MIAYYHIPQSKKNIPSEEILTISEQYQLKDAIHNKSITNIKILNMRNSNISDETIGLFWPISEPLQIISINLAENFSFITDTAIEHLCRCQGLKNLKQLNLADNSITNEGLLTLSKCPNMMKLQQLILYGNSDISSQGLIYLAQSEYIKSLKKLDLHDTSVCDKGLDIFLRTQNCGNLQSLDLSMNSKKVTDLTLRAMSSSKFFKSIKELKLQDCVVTDEGVSYLAESQNLSGLQVLNLNNSMKKKSNIISDQSLQQISYSKYIKKLKALEVRNTDVTSKGINSLSVTLGTENLQVLRLSYCIGVRDDAQRYLQSIAEYRSLAKLYINSTSISKEVAEQIGAKFPNLSVIY